MFLSAGSDKEALVEVLGCINTAKKNDDTTNTLCINVGKWGYLNEPRCWENKNLCKNADPIFCSYCSLACKNECQKNLFQTFTSTVSETENMLLVDTSVTLLHITVQCTVQCPNDFALA